MHGISRSVCHCRRSRVAVQEQGRLRQAVPVFHDEADVGGRLARPRECHVVWAVSGPGALLPCKRTVATPFSHMKNHDYHDKFVQLRMSHQVLRAKQVAHKLVARTASILQCRGPREDFGGRRVQAPRRRGGCTWGAARPVRVHVVHHLVHRRGDVGQLQRQPASTRRP